MKEKIAILVAIIGILFTSSCTKDTVFVESDYYNNLSFPDSSANHPKASLYQDIIDEFIENGGVATSVMIRDEYGTWLGVGGYADIKSNIKVKPGNLFLIASSSKTFTAAAAFLCIEEGLISLDDSVNKWIDQEICDQIDNCNESTIKDLIGHTSYIRDVYNSDHLMPYLNKSYHNWTDREYIKFVYGKKAYDEVGYWQYSNVNYALLSMALEKATGLSLKEIYEQKIFNPLNLTSAYYETGTERIAPGLVKGYSDIYSNNTFVEATEFYEDDIGVGGDGGIAINAQDLGKFIDELMKGNLVSEQSLAQMTDWFDGGYSTDGLAGYGLYYDNSDYGASIGHGGGIIGFEAGMSYYVDKDVTLIMLFNTDLILSTVEYDRNFNKFTLSLKDAIFNE
jgi:D-alanyl-D-alanine carboxypeptidase